LWLEGKVTATVAGDTFRDNFAPLIQSLGDYPHAKLNISAVRKVQSTRMLLAECPACNYKIRLTAKWSSTGLPWCSHGRTDAVNLIQFQIV
jgi:hypothetical protein